MRTLNLKFFGVMLFISVFLVGGLFTNIGKTFAEDNVATPNVVTALSSVTVNVSPNTIIPTMPLISCAIGSGDKYDMNTGKPCPKPTVISCAYGSGNLYDMNTGEKCLYDTKTVIIGCAPGSGDLYDMNTGERCLNTLLVACAPGSGDLYSVNTGKRCLNTLLVACAPGSGDKYDMNTGMKCLNDTTISCIKGSGDIYDIKTGKLCATGVVSGSISKLNDSINKTNNTTKLIASTGELTGFPKEEDVSLSETGSDLSGREKMLNSLTASAGRVGSIVKGPMSIWIILLIIAILLGGGYGVYSFITKDKKEKIKSDTVKPITPITKTQEVPLNTKPTPAPINTTPTETKTANTTNPATHTATVTASVNETPKQ